jgi:methionyl-tRNA synthetase
LLGKEKELIKKQVAYDPLFRFHAIYWPAFLMAAGLPLPKQILAHAHWTMGKQKMSKSKGNVADPFQVLEDYGVDPVRYYLVRDGGLADDGGKKKKNEYLAMKYGTRFLIGSFYIDYSEDMIKTRYKKDLAGQLGNLLNRATATSLLPSGCVPGNTTLDARDKELHDKIATVSGKEEKNLFHSIFF